MKLHELLLELNVPKLTNDFGFKLEQKYFGEFNDYITGEEIIKNISYLDPTPNKELTFWLCLNYAKNLINRFEDINARAIPALLKFKALLRKPNLEPKLQIRDINQIKGLSALEDIVEQYKEKDTSSNSKIADEKEQTFFKKRQAKLIYNDAQVKVVSPKTQEASCFFGVNTRWCTAATGSGPGHYNYFDDYNAEGPLYIVLLKKENTRYQFHFQSNQFMNEKDKSINPNELADQFPILWKIFTPIARKNKSAALNYNPSLRLQLKLINLNSKNIRYINNPAETTQINAISYDVKNIKYIKDPSEKLQLIAVGFNGSIIEYIKNPSEKVKLAAVKDDGYAIRYIDNPSEEIKIEAVKQDGYAINFIDNPSEAVKLEAVKQDGYAIQYIKNPTEEIQLLAVKQNGRAIKFIKKPSKKVQIAAVKENDSAIQNIKNPCQEVINYIMELRKSK